MTDYLLCCDWGTSSFRLCLTNQSDLTCLGEIRSQTGIASTFDNWKLAGETNGSARDQFFRQQLKIYVDQLADQLATDLTDIPVAISGMASSSIGMADVPYAQLPFALDGSRAQVQMFARQADFPHDCLLIGGVQSQQDVMRGEETQLIGLMALLRPSGQQSNDAVFIFPGTHSKHIQIRDRQLVNFDTYMTGEVFDLMARQSILNDSVDIRNLAEPIADELTAFKQGVHQSTLSNVLNTLFTVRTNQLFDKLTKTQNAFYLSGLLIGAELNHLQSHADGAFVLCSGSNLSIFYELAINELGLGSRTRLIPADVVDRAASVGQVIIYQHHTQNEPTP